LRLRLKDCWQQTLDFIEVSQIGKAMLGRTRQSAPRISHSGNRAAEMFRCPCVLHARDVYVWSM